jgi:serine/threonine-protein kinase
MQRLQKETLFAGRYLLIRQVGVGGFSEVWEARDQEADGVSVAIKIYAPGRGLDDDGITLFRKEYSITLPINHPHLLKVQYFGVYEGSPYLIMPYCSNGSVASLLNGGKTFTEEEAAALLAQLSDALAYLHSRNPAIIHQDIKPDNVLINEDGNFVLTDFGISSRMRHTMAKSTGKASTSMSIAYAPPERFSGTPRSLAASDVFSLGVMLYELCTGDVPWVGNGGAALLKGAEVPNLPPEYSRRFNGLVRSCLQLEPESRPTAVALAELSAKYRKEGYWDVPAGEPAAKAKKRFPARTAVLVAAALALLVVALGGLLLYNRQAATRGPVPVAAGPAEPGAGPEAGISNEDKQAKFNQFLALGEALLAKKDYAAALMQFYIAQAFASPADAERLRGKIESSQRLAQSRGVKSTEIARIRELADEKVQQEKQVLIARKTPASPPPATGPAVAAAPDTVASGNTRTEKVAVATPKVSAVELINQGEAFFRRGQFDDAFALFNKASRANVPAGHYYVGLSYSAGNGVRRNLDKAKEYFEKAVTGGYDLANYPLSLMYRTGRGAEKNEQKANEYHGKAMQAIVSQAEKGEVLPQYYFGETLENGYGTKGGKDEKSALDWYRKAADQGYAPAQYALGRLYNEGRGTKKDYAAANEWLGKAAGQGLRDAQFQLGYNYLLNHGRKDLAGGADLMRQAAGQNHPEAQYYLGVLSALGLGTAPDKEAARTLLQQAKDNGVTKAGNALAFLDGTLNQSVRGYNPETGDELEVTVNYRDNNPFTSLGLLTDEKSKSQVGKLSFQVRYKLGSPYPYCQVKPEGRGFEYTGNVRPLEAKEGTTTPYIARETAGILNDKVTVVMYYEKNNENDVRQRRELVKVDVPVFAVWL